MTVDKDPVWFTIKADFRPELAVRRRAALPYPAIVQAVFAFAVLGTGFGYLVSDRALNAPAPLVALNAAPAPLAVLNAAPTPPAPALPRPSLASTSAQLVIDPALVDMTPVGSIPARTAPQASARTGFAPVARSPDYEGFAVTAGR